MLLEADEADRYERSFRIEALSAWDEPVIICTADLVLGLIQNNRRSLFSFPSIANGAFVFDEIHQYDEHLFGSLLRFLEAFRGTPILLMTASLPTSRRSAIQKILEKAERKLEIIEGPSDLEEIKRYELAGPVKEPPWGELSTNLRKDGKVLWVANTVNRCIEFARQAREKGLEPLLYHSRYRYGDRVQRHNAVVQAFKESGKTLAVTTQVCEVSLDLSADLLVTDLAPIPALIQRMGRLNRRVTPDNPGVPKRVLILDVDKSLPYPQEEFILDGIRKWVADLSGAPISQADLARSFQEFSRNQLPSINSIKSAWLDGGPLSEPLPLREATAQIPVLRQEDASLCMSNNKPILKEITRYSIPMPLGQVAKEFGQWRRLGFAFVAPEGRIDYSEEWGAKWAKK